MIPTSLKLHNFTAYGPNTPELDFRPLNLVVLSGNNGAGKSSILDAITWCIWGWSRAGDNADRLVRLGQAEMWVEFSFELEGTEYTIVRTRKTTGVGTTTLQFFAGTDRQNNLTEGTIRATQEKITDTLHLTYDTFVNSSYLRQNHADEFTLKGPNDRKKILADILGLDRYDRLEEAAKLRAKAASDQIMLLDVQIGELAAEVASGGEHEKAQSETESRLKAIQAKLHLVEQELAEVTTRKEKHAALVETRRAEKERLAKLLSDLAKLKLEKEDLKTQLLEFKNLIADKDNINAKFEKLSEIADKIKNYEGIQRQVIAVKDEIVELERKLQEIEIVQAGVIKKADALGEEKKRQQQILDRAKQDQSTCPTCGQDLKNDDVHQRVITKLTAEVEAKENEIEKLRQEWSEKKLEKKPIETEIAEKSEARDKLEQDLSDLPELQKERDELLPYHQLKTKLEVDSAKAKAAKESYLRIEQEIARLEETLPENPNLDLGELEDKLIEWDRQQQTKDLAVQTLRQEEGTTREALARARELVSRVTQMTETLAKKKKEQSAAAQTKTDYEELAQAFGKRGIQAMLIESAIPEIEEEANLLLDKLTDGRMQIQLLTQRENKTGGIAETLDIVISDELGARPYEMYSGGEAFRINLALRLALSRLLTHRAGAKLQFLIIDEGFGTQDDQGKDKVVQAINAISGEFSKILVVTHDPDLKDAFPQRIEVVRGAAGSMFEVSA